MTQVECAVVGAGAAGLAAALALHGAGREVRVLEAREAPGGVMQSCTRDGFLFERGPNTFRISAGALPVLRAAGVEGALVRAAPESRARFLLGPEGLVPVPLGPLALARSPLLSARGKLRLLAEPFTARGDASDETVAEFIGRRLGPEVVDALVGPFLVGVYAGDERQLGAEAVFPSLVAFEREAGSIVKGALRAGMQRGRARGRPGSWSARGGLGALAAALAASLGQGAVQTDATVQALERHGDGWRLLLEGEVLDARAVVLAADAPSAAALLAPLVPEAAAFARGVPYAPLASVPLDVDPAAVGRAIEGFGFLVPRSAGVELLGALYMSRLFPGRAPAGRELVMGMIGGLRWPGVVDADDADLLERVLAGLDRGVGLRHAPRALAVQRWRRAVPQPGPGHPARARAARAALEGLPPIALAGSWLDGVSVSDTLASGFAAGGTLLARG